MRVTVNIYSYLRSYIQNSDQLMREKDWDVPQYATAGYIVQRLKLPKEVRVTILINSNSVDQKAILKEGDVIHILPQMGGG